MAEGQASFLSCIQTPTNSIDEQESGKPLSMETLASMRSLIINPSIPQLTISSICQTLTRSLQISQDKLVTHHTLKLLTDLTYHHSQFCRRVFDLVRSQLLSIDSNRLAVELLEVLVSISQVDPSLSSEICKLDDSYFASLCFGQSISARVWLLKNAERFHVRPSLLLTLFWGFTMDPYPYVRKAALDGLEGLSKCVAFIEDSSLVQACYHRAVKLLGDMEDCVRSASVRVVASWGLMTIQCHPNRKSYLSNEVFARLCSMARDMSVDVRVEAFNALGKMKLVSEGLLLQSLSKRVTGIEKERVFSDQCDAEQFESLASSAAGALLHGLEDEFHEVRNSACRSLCTLTTLSPTFASQALNLLMGMLNDDSVGVRLQALETICHMASTCDTLKFHEGHMHVLLCAALDNDTTVRSATRRILKLVKLRDRLLFKLSTDCLLENLEKYPQDEADIFTVLSHIGRNHGRFVARILENAFEEIEAAFAGKSEFNSARIAAVITLCVSATILPAPEFCVPPVIFSYAVAFLGRIACAFSDVMDRDGLLAFLTEQSGSSEISIADTNDEETESHMKMTADHDRDCFSNEINASARSSEKRNERTNEIQSHTMWDPMEITVSHVGQQHVLHLEVIHHIFARVEDIWPLIELGLTNEVLSTLRHWKEELEMLSNSFGSQGDTTFTLHYLRIIKQLAGAWECFLPTRLQSYETGEFDLKFGKLEKRIREIRCRFTGFSIAQKLHILELNLVAYCLRLRDADIYDTIVEEKLIATVSYIHTLLEEGSHEPSNFLAKVLKLYESGASTDGASSSIFLFDQCLGVFSLKQFPFTGGFMYSSAKLDIPGTDWESPIKYICGLPVSIPCEITLYNTSTESRIWLSMTRDDNLTHYVYVDLNLFEAVGEIRKFATNALFYRTPHTSSFVLKVCIGLECVFDKIDPVARVTGPKHELVKICPEKEIYLSNVRNR